MGRLPLLGYASCQQLRSTAILLKAVLRTWRGQPYLKLPPGKRSKQLACKKIGRRPGNSTTELGGVSLLLVENEIKKLQIGIRVWNALLLINCSILWQSSYW
jgi:hypothetical protein